MRWSAPFEVYPIPTPEGKTLRTLADARDYILKMPETLATHDAAGELLKAAEHGGPFLMIARIMVYKAIWGDGEPAKKARKETWREKRKAAVARRSTPRR